MENNIDNSVASGIETTSAPQPAKQVFPPYLLYGIIATHLRRITVMGWIEFLVLLCVIIFAAVQSFRYYKVLPLPRRRGFFMMLIITVVTSIVFMISGSRL